MRKAVIGVMGLAMVLGVSDAHAGEQAAAAKPTVVLVHGAFADASSWNGVIARLERDGFKAVAAANPLRSLAGDTASVAALVQAQSGPVVLVGHSYGGQVISGAAHGAANVKALVYVAGFIPASGESALSLAAKFPGSTLGDALLPAPLAGGGLDLYIRAARFHAQFAADVPAVHARRMAATQRPVTEAALTAPATAAAWERLPTYVIYGADDRSIPAAAMVFMAGRAKARKTVALEGASHALMLSHPEKVSALIAEAAEGR